LKVGIGAVGHSKFGKRLGMTIYDLVHEATEELFSKFDVTHQDIDASVVGVAGDQFNGQGAPAAIIADYVGVHEKSAFRVEAACATGSHAIRSAYGLIHAGLAKTVLVMAVERMTAVSSREATGLMARAGDLRWETSMGVTFPAFYALLASRHMAEFGTKREHLSGVGVKNHKYGKENPRAHLRKDVTLEEAMNSVMICEPLNLYDCSLISDGGAAIILASEDVIKKYTDTPVWLTGVGSSNDTMKIAERSSLTGLPAAKRAAEMAYKMSGKSPSDIDVAEVHDCFTIAEIMAYEDLGFCKKGEGGKFIEEEQSYAGGKTPVNIDGGLKSKGHPVGCTGVSQAVTMYEQLTGTAPASQLDPVPEIGLQHNVGQSGQFVNVFVYER